MQFAHSAVRLLRYVIRFIMKFSENITEHIFPENFVALLIEDVFNEKVTVSKQSARRMKRVKFRSSAAVESVRYLVLTIISVFSVAGSAAKIKKRHMTSRDQRRRCRHVGPAS